MAQLNFDASTVAPQEAFEPLPAGWYPVQITESEMKPTNKPGGAFLATTMQIMGGEYNNRKVFDRFNLQNANPVAVEIAYRSLSAVCHAVGLIQVPDSQMLHGKPLLVKLSVRPARVDPATQTAYDASNEVKGYKAIEAGGAAVAGAPASGAPAWATGAAPAAAPAAPAAFAPPAPPAPPAPMAPPAPVVFPPAGWTAHPQAPGYFYQGQEVLAEADLRARTAPVVPVAPPAPLPVQPAFVAPVTSFASPVGTPVVAPAVAAPAAAIPGPGTVTPPWMNAAPVAPATAAVAPAAVAPAPAAVAPAPVAGAVPPWAVAATA